MTNQSPFEMLARNRINLHGDDGRRWVDALPERVRYYEDLWDLRIDEPFPDLTFNFAAPGVRPDGQPVVLKIGYPDPESRSEREALRLIDGDGLVRLLDADDDGSAILIERVTPGTVLLHEPDDEVATAAIARLMRRIARPIDGDHPFPTVEGWRRAFRTYWRSFPRSSGPLDPELVRTAEETYAGLVATTERPYLLHGDLQHYNVLRQDDGWIAIDPKGVVGDPAFEIFALAYNRLPPLDDIGAAERLLARRIAIVADITGLDPARLRGWAFAGTILSALWTTEYALGSDGIGLLERLARIYAGMSMP